MNSFYTEEELKKMGLKKIGKNVFISKKSSIYGASNITIGDNVRIDDFCILSGKITLGDYIHIAAYSALYGGNKGIIMKDFSGLSSRISIYTQSDDYSGETMTNPMIDLKYKNIKEGKVEINEHVIIGASTVILPGVIIEEGVAVGAMSLVNKSLEAWWIYSGVPVKRIKERKRDLLNLEKEFLKDK